MIELHGPGASAYIDLGFGEARCSARILSDRYERYYGYYDEDRLFFLDSVTSLASQRERLSEDYATVELVHMLLENRI